MVTQTPPQGAVPPQMGPVPGGFPGAAGPGGPGGAPPNGFGPMQGGQPQGQIGGILAPEGLANAPPAVQGLANVELEQQKNKIGTQSEEAGQKLAANSTKAIGQLFQPSGGGTA
jgi:hypothetical protein